MLCGLTVALPAAELTPGATPPWSIFNANERQQSLEYLQTAGKPAIRLKWQEDRFGYLELFLPNQIAPVFPENRPIRCTVDLTTFAATPLFKVNLRLMDRTGEVFQFSRKVFFDRAGQWQLEYLIDSNNPSPNGAWGGNKDLKLDFPIRILGLAFEFPQNSGPGEIQLNAIRYETTSAAVASAGAIIDSKIETGHPFDILIPGQESKFKIHLTNTTDRTVSADLNFIITDIDEHALPAQQSRLELPPRASQYVNLPTPPALGIWYIKGTVTPVQNQAATTRFRRSIAYMTPAAATPFDPNESFQFGVCSHPDSLRLCSDAQVGQEAEAAALCGAKVLRVDFRWANMEPQKGRFNFTRQDLIVQEFSRRGIQFDAILGSCPQWSGSSGRINDPNADRFREWVRTLFTHYRGQIRYWEMWNEPDLPHWTKFGVEVYLELARIARQEQVAIDPSALMMSAGWTRVLNCKPGFQETAMKTGQVENLFDIHAFHGHGWFTSYVEMIEEQGLLPMRRRLSISMPWYANETAIHSANGEKDQAVTLFKKLLYSWSRGAVGYNWYDLRNDGFDAGNMEHNFGLLTHDFQPKAVYVAYTNMAQNYRHKKFYRQLPLPPQCWALEFQGKNDFIYALWSDDYSQQQIFLRTDAKQATIIDLMGNRRPADRIADLVLVPISSETISLHLTGATRSEFAGQAVRFIGRPDLVPGQTTKFKLEFTNPLPTDQTLALTLQPPDGIKLGQEQAALTVPPRSALPWETTLEVPATYEPKMDRPTLVRVNYRQGKSPVVSHLAVPLSTIYRIKTDFAVRPDFVRDQVGQVCSLHYAEGSGNNKVWESPKDLSAKVWIAGNSTELQIKIEVQDDQHCQNFPAEKIWKGDSVQVVINVPGKPGQWDLGFALNDRQQTLTHIWNSPSHGNLEAMKKALAVTAQNNGKTITYLARIPLALLQLDATGKFRMNLIVNDNDGIDRKGWIALAPGYDWKLAGWDFLAHPNQP